MDLLLYAAAFLTILIGITHSYLGEKYILIRLFRRDNIPHLFGSADFTIKTLRFAWHITTIAWWGLAGIIVLTAQSALNSTNVLLVIAITFLISGFITVVASKGKHYAWVIFFLIGFSSLIVALSAS
ncbi:hypothetical protein FLL45_22475 [Aliikangiella marina]|uniref:Uncharacterized protein n=1 Tax=Aliikangiella marina TaxID=1712262 RepID=A0A545T1K0_9GAMM|nr:hypothetical protein [Aliikangiella marina]TQV71096.1 hypothetical protein FLL45_22475 [Aliikangiella marina]